jgi:hypothetical protein
MLELRFFSVKLSIKSKKVQFSIKDVCSTVITVEPVPEYKVILKKESVAA